MKCESSDIKETLDNEYKKFDSYNFQKRNKCFILFIEKDNVDKDDIKLLVESSYIYISLEVILRVVQDVPIVVLIDNNKKCAYCVPIKKGNISFYNIGYKFAKKIMYPKDNQN